MYLYPSWQIAVLHLIPAIGLTLSLAFLAWGIGSVTGAGALAGGFLTLLLCFSAGTAALVPVFVVFALTVASTRMGRRKKERLGAAERGRGRDARQIFANLAVAALCAAPLLVAAHSHYLLLAGASAALAEAAGDTVSSELGQVLGGRPRLITTLQQVAPGTDGAITIAGTFFAFAAASVVGFACQWAGLLLPSLLWTVVFAAFFGTLVDSLLGATLERPGRLGNNSVNYTSAACSAWLTIAVLFLQH